MATISVSHDQGDDEASLWAAVERLPPSDRLRTSVLKFDGENGKLVDVTKLSVEDQQHVLERILRDTEEGKEPFLRKLRERLDRVGIDLPKVEVRYHHLNVVAEAHPGSRAPPSLPRFFLSFLQLPWHILGLGKKGKINILSDVSGILKPTRLTLLLGPPASGRTSFLRSLAGRLGKDLQVSGEVTYNGHHMSEFIPRKTSAYISQYDLHTAELTVREQIDFFNRVQGVGNKNDILTELARREKEQRIVPDADVDIYLKATAVTGQSANFGTDYTMKLIGLDTLLTRRSEIT